MQRFKMLYRRKKAHDWLTENTRLIVLSVLLPPPKLWQGGYSYVKESEHFFRLVIEAGQ